MAQGRIMKCVLFILILMNTCVYSDIAFSENVGPPNLQSPGEMIIPQNISQEFCDSLFPFFKDLKDLCQILQLGNLPDQKKINKDDLFNFVKAAQGRIQIFTDPDKFMKTARDPERLVRMLGFDKVSQLADVEPGAAVVIKDVPLRELRDFKIEKNPEDITHERGKVAVPLYVREEGMVSQGRSMLIFGLIPEKTRKWGLIQRGISRSFKRMFKYRKNENLLIEIPGLGQRFLGEKKNGVLYLTPLENSKFGTLELKAGEAQSAKDIFVGLAPEAKEIAEVDGIKVGRRPLR